MSIESFLLLVAILICLAIVGGGFGLYVVMRMRKRAMADFEKQWRSGK